MTEESTAEGPTSKFQQFVTWLGSYRGLITATIVYEFLIVVFLTTFSEPVTQMLGQPLIPITLEDSHRIARIIMVYHSLGIVFLGAVVLFALDLFDVRPKFEPLVKWSIIPGYVLTSVSGMTFAYLLPENWIAHALFIVGLTLVFISGVLLLMGTWPTKNFPEKQPEGPYLFGVNWAQWAVALVVIALLISAMLGAGVGAYFGNGFKAILAEDFLRVEDKDLFVRAVVGHLHIMLALIDAAVMLIVFRYTNPEQRGKWYLAGMILSIPGTLIISIGAWLVPVGYEKAHMVINVGAVFALLAAFILAIWGWKKTVRDVLGEEYESAGIGRRIIALFKDPVKFGLYFQFIWVNIVVTAPGIYVAINLEHFRTEIGADVERAFAVGHWHVLGVLTAVIALLLAFDYLDVGGWTRQIVGWSLTLGSIIGFGFANAYMLEEIGIATGFAFSMIDVGIILLVIGIAVFCIYMLVQILKGRAVK